MNIKSARYITSAVNKKGLLIDDIPEVAFVGRSNVGKSSLINNLVGMKKLAKTSSTPGLTKMVNYFDINNGAMRFVDLPGYGYAKVGKSQKDIWSSLISDYLLNSQSLKLIFVLLDIRHDPSELDKMMLDYLISNKFSFAIITTKCDKLSKSAINKSLENIASKLNIRKEVIFTYSSETGVGKKEILEFLSNI